MLSGYKTRTATTNHIDNEEEFTRHLQKNAAYTAKVLHVKSIFVGVLLLIAALGVWQIVYVSGLVNPVFVSHPSAVVGSFFLLLTEAKIWIDVWSTFRAAFAALILGSAGGVIVGVFIYKFPPLRRGSRPLVAFLNALPRPAVAPIFLLWFGLGFFAKTFVASTLVFFVILLSTVAGLDDIDPDIQQLCDSLAIRPVQRLLLVELPAASSPIFAGLRLGAVLAILGVVVTELVASYRGLGLAEAQATSAFNIPGAFAILVLMGLFAVVFDFALGIVEKRWFS